MNLSQIIERKKEEFVEVGADLEHDRWSRWQKYMFSKGMVDSNGVFHLPKELVDRWFRQIEMKYSELSEREKESDRKETREYLPQLEKAIRESVEEALREVIVFKKTGTMAYMQGYEDALKDLYVRVKEFMK